MKSGYGVSGHIGRILIGLSFLGLGILNLTQWQVNLVIAEKHHLPSATILLGIAIGAQILLGVLMAIGKFYRFAASLLIIFSLIFAPFFLDFWNMSGPAEIIALVQFISLIAIIGGLFAVIELGNNKSHY